MAARFVYAHRVRPDEIDFQGRASNEVYLRWLNAAAVAHSAAQGLPLAAYQKLGAGFVVRRHEIEYRVSARNDDELLVTTWVASIERATSLRRYEISRPRDGALIATASSLWAFVSHETGRLTRIPPEVAGAFEVVADERTERLIHRRDAEKNERN